MAIATEMLDFPKRRVDFSWLQITAKMKLMTRRWRGARPWRSWGGAERNCGWNRESRDNTHVNGECGHLYPVLPDPTHLCSATSCLRSLFSSPIWLWPGEATHSDLLSRKRVNDPLPPPPKQTKNCYDKSVTDILRTWFQLLTHQLFRLQIWGVGVGGTQFI